jgi:hypothetical protein
MRILIIHHETQFFGGAERMLEYFLVELVRHGCQVAVATVPGSRVASTLPPRVIALWIEPCPAFSPWRVWRQATALKDHSMHFFLISCMAGQRAIGSWPRWPAGVAAVRPSAPCWITQTRPTFPASGGG